MYGGNKNKRTFAFIALGALALPSLATASPITVLPVLSASAELTSPVPDGLTISVNAFANPTVSVDAPVSEFFGFVEFLIAGDPGNLPPIVVDFGVTFEFGDSVGEVSFSDSFGLLEGPPFPGFGPDFVYLSCICGGFEFGLSGMALIGQPGAFDIFASIPVSGDTVTVPYLLNISSFDVPLPPAAWLLASGLFALFASRRH